MRISWQLALGEPKHCLSLENFDRSSRKFVISGKFYPVTKGVSEILKRVLNYLRRQAIIEICNILNTACTFFQNLRFGQNLMINSFPDLI